MTDLVVVTKEVKKYKTNGEEFFSTIKITCCENCGEQIYAPSNDVVYEYCYACGKHFKTPVDYKYVKAKKKRLV